MPLYAFRCAECSSEFEERFVRVSAEPKANCTECGSEKTEKIFGIPASVGLRSLSESPAIPEGCGVGPPCGALACGRRPV